jgi:GTP-binding protein Era
MHRSGFVNIVGKPNVGKSTLLNALIGERMSIITHKPQTTRHRIIGLLTGEDFQIVFSDTPGYIKDPSYKMHRAMNRQVEGTLEDADLLLVVVDLTEAPDEDHPVLAFVAKAAMPILLVLNKKDAVSPEVLSVRSEWWQERIKPEQTFAISAKGQDGTVELLEVIKAKLPEGPAYYPEDELSDRTERFFVSEIIRENILLLYSDEIPYSVEVSVEGFKDTTTTKGENLARISANIYVSRETQKAIMLGKQGLAIKRLGTDARKGIEDFLQRKVFLELTVKVRENWRDDDKALQRFGYI